MLSVFTEWLLYHFPSFLFKQTFPLCCLDAMVLFDMVKPPAQPATAVIFAEIGRQRMAKIPVPKLVDAAVYHRERPPQALAEPVVIAEVSERAHSIGNTCIEFPGIFSHATTCSFSKLEKDVQSCSPCSVRTRCSITHPPVGFIFTDTMFIAITSMSMPSAVQAVVLPRFQPV